MGKKDIRGQVVVITGASSGIGRAAANAFAERGARLVLAARRKHLLKEAAADCRSRGTEAVAVATDVTIPDDVLKLRDEALRAFGRIDVWINNAGTGVFGPYLEAPLELHRRTVEVDLLGAMHGAYAALGVFEAQGQGTLINNVSLGGWSPAPLAAAYTAAKFGLRGFSASLRQEYADRPAIHVCAVFPAMIDTPGLAHGANVTGKNIDTGPLLYRAEQVAETFVALVRRPRDEVAVGWPARAAQVGYALARGPVERLIAAAMRRSLARAEPGATREGSLLLPTDNVGNTDGGWLARKKVPDAPTLSVLGSAGFAALALGAFLMRKRSSASGERLPNRA